MTPISTHASHLPSMGSCVMRGIMSKPLTVR